MIDPNVERHFAMVDREKSIERMQHAVRCLEAARVDFIVEGGWAVAAFGSPVPSIDLDVLVAGGLTEELAEDLEAATGYQMFSQATHDALALEFVDSTHPNPFIDRPGLSYTPSVFLVGHVEHRPVDIVDGLVLPVPEAPRLAFMKLKAYHDRLIQWRAVRGERFLLGAMAEEERIRTMRLGEDHWLRKVGKDLFDASLLCAGHTTIEEIKEIAPSGMWPPIDKALEKVPLAIRVFAEDMAERAGRSALRLIGS
jgi:hypothetical protein